MTDELKALRIELLDTKLQLIQMQAMVLQMQRAELVAQPDKQDDDFLTAHRIPRQEKA